MLLSIAASPDDIAAAAAGCVPLVAAGTAALFGSAATASAPELPLPPAPFVPFVPLVPLPPLPELPLPDVPLELVEPSVETPAAVARPSRYAPRVFPLRSTLCSSP